MSMVTKSDIDQLEHLINQMINHLHQATYEEIVDYVDRAGHLVQKIEIYKNELSSTEKLRLRALIVHDGVILSRMQALKNEAREWLLKQGSIREQRTAYSSSYTPDSMFFDRKN
ncbi:hypothetical protein [Paenibacillus sp. Marseille-Q4541]|uniref:hypothetical protein n=1 Tax=Paenibacillus sp. Marseille-Q4541 TaxID=2831522 RepID=UPI001BAD19EF|nr:hypothetical protein [Paenibacillus sp. Marseille-Q4541]